MRCDTIADGVIEAANLLKSNVPLVVRLQGTNVDEATKKMDGSGLKIHSTSDMTQAAKLAVDLAKKA